MAATAVDVYTVCLKLESLRICRRFVRLYVTVRNSLAEHPRTNDSSTVWFKTDLIQRACTTSENVVLKSLSNSTELNWTRQQIVDK